MQPTRTTKASTRLRAVALAITGFGASSIGSVAFPILPMGAPTKTVLVFVRSTIAPIGTVTTKGDWPNATRANLVSRMPQTRGGERNTIGTLLGTAVRGMSMSLA